MARRMQTVAPPAAPTAQTPVAGTAGQGRFIQSVHSDVTMPLQASAITGVLIATLMALLAGAIAYAQRTPFTVLAIPLLFGWITVALVTMIIAWFRERHDIKQTWWRELRDGVDYDNDHHLGPTNPDAMQIRGSGDDPQRRSQEDLTQLRFEEFIARLYNAGKTNTQSIRRLGFSEPERVKFIAALRDASLTRSVRGGNSAAWEFIPPDAESCIRLARKRVMWRIPSSSSSSSPAK